jgi:hypothetical protein
MRVRTYVPILPVVLAGKLITEPEGRCRRFSCWEPEPDHEIGGTDACGTSSLVLQSGLFAALFVLGAPSGSV